MSASPPIVELRAVIDTNFNGIILEGVLYGIYTLLLSQALWNLLKKGNKKLYSTALILLWVAIFLEVTSDWASIRRGFVVENSSPLSIFMNSYSDASVLMLGDVSKVMRILISDAILIWRCNIMWHNAYVLSALVILLVGATGLNISGLIIYADSSIVVLVDSLAVLSTFITTVSATLLIALKIFLVTRQSRMRHSYTKVIEIVIESAALVSMVLLFIAILALVSYVHPWKLYTASGRVFSQAFNYLTFCQGSITGIGPTLIAFRVSRERSQTEVDSTNQIGPLSRLNFRKAAHGTSTNCESAHAQGSNIRLASSNEGEHINGMQTPVVAEVQTHATDAEDKKVLARLKNVRSLESV